MKQPLLTWVTQQLLDEFGIGSHKPGSGSAAALQGMISAKLLVTVISITNSPKYRARYAESLPDLLEMQSKINDRIYPELAKLFEQDSIQFGKTIDARDLRDNEIDLVKRNQLGRSALAELKISIDIPLEIAALCVEIAHIGRNVFDRGFQSARGDSQVGLSGAVAAIAGCLSIVQLNLLPFGSDEYNWIANVKQKCDSLKLQYDKLNQIANDKMDVLARKVEAKATFYKEVDQLLNSTKSRERLTNDQLEQFATNLQNLVWVNRHSILGMRDDITSMDVLNPLKIFEKVLGYEFDNSNDLGYDFIDGQWVDIAGLIDQDNKLVQISNHTSSHLQNFTAAHELGHALLHKQSLLHRDIPIDGSNEQRDRPIEEIQADRFASFFLMPRKLVEQRFKQLFLTNEFQINSETAFRLTGNSSAIELKNECKNLRGLSLKLASAKSFGEEFFDPISTHFNVSVKAMAIRLEQLNLVKF